MSIAVAAVTVMLAVGGVMPASAQSVLSLSVSPSTVQAGGKFALSWAVASERYCRVITFESALGGIPGATVPPLSGSRSVAVPANAKPTAYSITGYCGNYQQTVRVVVTTPPTTTTRPPTTTTRPPVRTTTTRPPVVTTRPPTTTRRPPVRTTRPTTTTTTPPLTTTTTTTTTTTPPTTTPPTTTDTPATTTGAAPGDLTLDRESVQPGEPLSAKGTGCTPDTPVRLTSGGETVGTSFADGAGVFTARIEFAKVEPGRHLITAECGIVLTGTVDQLVTSSIGGGSTALVVLVFFVLAGAALIRFS
ncbi:hypothetical protein ACTG9Q_11535 [Actinokineospora sp. 24-640]